MKLRGSNSSRDRSLNYRRKITTGTAWLLLSLLGGNSDGHAQSAVPGSSHADGIMVNAPELGMEVYGAVVLAICTLLAGLIYAKTKLTTGNGETRRSFTIGAKILTGVWILAAVTTAMAAVVIMRMTEVREQMEAVADLNMIAIDTAILLNGEQREQAILLEQILRSAASSGIDTRATLDGAIDEFHRRSENVKTAIGEDIAHLTRKRIHSTGEADLARETIRKLEHVQSQRAQFDAHASTLFSALATGGPVDLVAEAALTAKSRELNQLLQEYLLGVEDRAQRALGRARAKGEQVLWLTVALAGTVVLVSLLLGWLGANSIGRGLDRVVAAAARMRSGDLSGPPLIANSGDESGALATSLDDLRSQLVLLAEHAEEVAVGRGNTEAVLQRVRAGVTLADAVDQVTEEGQPVPGDLADSFSKVSASLSSIVAQAEMLAAEDVASGSEQPGVTGMTDAVMAAVGEKMVALSAALTAQTEKVEQQRRQMQEMAGRADSVATEVYSASQELSIRVQAVARIDDGQRDTAVRTAAATGEMSVAAREAAGKTEILAATVNEATSHLQALASEVESVIKTAQSLDQALESSAGSIDELVDGMQAQSESAAAVEEAAQQTGSAAAVWERLAREAGAGVEQIADQVAVAAAAVGGVGGRTHALGEMASVLSDISDQANLVALNAGIEAARAGASGRGLAVVSDEAAQLSTGLTGAVARLNGMIEDIRRDSGQAVETMERVKVEVREGSQSVLCSGKGLEQVGGHAGKVSDLVSTMKEATDLQTRAGEGIVATAVEVRRSAQRVIASMAERSQSLDRAMATVVDAVDLATELTETAQAHAGTIEEIVGVVKETSDRAAGTTSAIEEVAESSRNLDRRARELRQSEEKSNGKRTGSAAAGGGEAESGDDGLLKTVTEN